MRTISIDFENAIKKEQKKILAGAVVPRPIAWITSLNKEGGINLAPFSYFSMTSNSTLAVSFIRNNGQKKDTANNILRNGEGVVHIAHDSLIELVDESSQPLNSRESEVALLELDTIKSSKIKTPRLSKALVALETTLLKHIEIMGQDEVESDLLLLRVVMSHLSSEIYEQSSGYYYYDKHLPLARLAGPLYGKVAVIEGFERKY